MPPKQSFEFLDAIGESLYEIMKVTPGGVLCFFPSYKLLTKVVAVHYNCIDYPHGLDDCSMTPQY